MNTRILQTMTSGSPMRWALEQSVGSLVTLVQASECKISAQNNNYDSSYRNPTYHVVGYFGSLRYMLS